MNIKFKRSLRAALCLLLCAAFFTGGVFAAGKLQKRTITVYSGVDIYIDDAKLDARDANGNPVETFVYNGTTYLPVRAVGEAVGHQEVDHVGRGETLACGRAFGACRDLIGNLELPFPLREYEVVGARLRVGFHLHVHE